METNKIDYIYIVDSETEHKLLDNLHEVTVDKTTIFIAHRLSTVVDVDEILVLHDGRVVEHGSHWELLSNPNSRYSAMWEMQSQANTPQPNKTISDVIEEPTVPENDSGINNIVEDKSSDNSSK